MSETLKTKTIRPETQPFPPNGMPLSVLYWYQPETMKAAQKIPVGTVNHESHRLGMRSGEPLIVALDCLLTYAKAYRKRMDGPLADDGVLGVAWAKALKGIRGMLDGDGAVAWMIDRSTDSKSNGAMADLVQACLAAAGFEERDL